MATRNRNIVQARKSQRSNNLALATETARKLLGNVPASPILDAGRLQQNQTTDSNNDLL